MTVRVMLRYMTPPARNAGGVSLLSSDSSVVRIATRISLSDGAEYIAEVRGRDSMARLTSPLGCSRLRPARERGGVTPANHSTSNGIVATSDVPLPGRLEICTVPRAALPPRCSPRT